MPRPEDALRPEPERRDQRRDDQNNPSQPLEFNMNPKNLNPNAIVKKMQDSFSSPVISSIGPALLRSLPKPNLAIPRRFPLMKVV